jgi:anaerobic magnesium-protoporphyrin IX monomethyl ester cyclase
MPKKILFVIPPHIPFEDYVNPHEAAKWVRKMDGKVYGNLVTDMPLGVLALSSYLKASVEDIQVRLLDFNVRLNALQAFDYSSFYDYFETFFTSWDDDFVPDIVGLSVQFSPAYQSLLDLARICKDTWDCTVIAGGHIPTNMYSDIFQQSDSVDYICFGEGERPLVRYMKEGADALVDDAWITRDKIQKQGWAPAWNHIQDLDEIPFLDYGLCHGEYNNNPAFITYGKLSSPVDSFHVMTSRGCPYRCIFCASHKVHGRKMRYYSIGRVRHDLKSLVDDFGARVIVFQDDHFMADKKRALVIIRYLSELVVDVVFQNSLSLHALDREVLIALVDAGIRQLVLSIESGSERVLRHVMKKPLDLNTVRRVVQTCKELGIYMYANILIGLPGETKQDIEDSIKYLKTLGANWYGIFCASPLTGSEMHDICVANRYLKGDWLGADYKKAVVETEEWSSEYIKEMAYRMNLELNFIYNTDFHAGNYSVALEGFLRVIRAKEDHYFANYYAAKCCEYLGEVEKAKIYKEKARESEQDLFWKKYIDFYDSEIQGSSIGTAGMPGSDDSN